MKGGEPRSPSHRFSPFFIILVVSQGSDFSNPFSSFLFDKVALDIDVLIIRVKKFLILSRLLMMVVTKYYYCDQIPPADYLFVLRLLPKAPKEVFDLVLGFGMVKKNMINCGFLK